jgi:hypothetical protein
MQQVVFEKSDLGSEGQVYEARMWSDILEVLDEEFDDGNAEHAVTVVSYLTGTTHLHNAAEFNAWRVRYLLAASAHDAGYFRAYDALELAGGDETKARRHEAASRRASPMHETMSMFDAWGVLAIYEAGVEMGINDYFADN